MFSKQERMARRSFLGGAAALGVGTVALGAGVACSSGSSPAQAAAGLPQHDFKVPAGAAGATQMVNSGAQSKLPPPNRTGVKKPYDPKLPPLLDPSTPFELVSSEAVVEVNTDTMMNAWTFGGTIPAPVIHVTQGDTMKVTFRNNSKMPHSVDFHAAFTPMGNGDPMGLLAPGETKNLALPIPHPGTFMYHCGAPPVFQHIGSGMYGMVVSDPKGGWPSKADHEYAIVCSELYLQDDTGGKYTTSTDKLLAVTPDYMAFNGAAFQYLSAPLAAKPGELVRLHVVNAGPTIACAFHVIGTIFEAVYPSGNPANRLQALQTWGIPPGDGAAFELRIPDAGTYPFVTHAFAYTELGAIGAIKVG